ncbi:hypothetical protein GUJ93_ZPchr0006g45022 [Zizania palustris]|uniref:Uncharacterized protein n=1 Tax=Zizania palustris TaxID=103762 RepID=A0A8J5W3P1_ZIZPA|nr:hypothetical protein GUJ93_ZPchr0006g45022 [Zizania palustris]
MRRVSVQVYSQPVEAAQNPPKLQELCSGSSASSSSCSLLSTRTAGAYGCEVKKIARRRVRFRSRQGD